MKWSGQMVLGSDAAGSSNDGPVPMEVDRIESKGKHKGGSKGKTKDKNSSKGKRKKKEKMSNGKAKVMARKEQRVAKMERESEPKQCYVCGKARHFARECWPPPQVRNAASDAGQSTAMQSSATPSLNGVTSISHQQEGQPMPVVQSPATQHTVARIVDISDAVSKHDDLVFDMRDSSPSSAHGSVHVVHH